MGLIANLQRWVNLRETDPDPGDIPMYFATPGDHGLPVKPFGISKKNVREMRRLARNLKMEYAIEHFAVLSLGDDDFHKRSADALAKSLGLRADHLGALNQGDPGQDFAELKRILIAKAEANGTGIFVVVTTEESVRDFLGVSDVRPATAYPYTLRGSRDEVSPIITNA